MVGNAIPSAIREHAEKLSDLLISKGYTSKFHVNPESYGKLPGALTDHLRRTLKEDSKISPFSIFGYTQWNGTDKDRVIAHLDVSYANTDGFRIDRMSINRHQPENCLVAHQELNPVNNQSIPSLAECNRLVEVPNRFLDEKLGGQIDEFSKVMQAKGFREFDFGPISVPLKEVLERETKRAYTRNHILPFTLSTSVFSAERMFSQRRPVIHCNFDTNYSTDKGFSVHRLLLSSGLSAFGPDQRKPREFLIKHNEALPSSSQVFQLRNQHKKALKH